MLTREGAAARALAGLPVEILPRRHARPRGRPPGLPRSGASRSCRGRGPYRLEGARFAAGDQCRGHPPRGRGGPCRGGPALLRLDREHAGHRHPPSSGRRREPRLRIGPLPLCRHQARGGAARARSGGRGARRGDRQSGVHARPLGLEALVGADAAGIATGWAILAPRGGNDFCDVRDVAGGILAALARGRRGRRYILGVGESLSFMEAWTMFAGIIGVRPRRRKSAAAGAVDLRPLGRFAGLDQRPRAEFE